jgi:hypothetical protein
VTLQVKVKETFQTRVSHGSSFPELLRKVILREGKECGYVFLGSVSAGGWLSQR